MEIDAAMKEYEKLAIEYQQQDIEEDNSFKIDE